MVYILLFGAVLQFVIQAWADTGLINSLPFLRKRAPVFRYKLSTNLLIRGLWNLLSSGLISIALGTMTGFYGPLIMIASNVAYELYCRLPIIGPYTKWKEEYVHYLNSREGDKAKVTIRAQILKHAKKNNITNLLEEDILTLIESEYQKQAQDIETSIQENKKRKETYVSDVLAQGLGIDS